MLIYILYIRYFLNFYIFRHNNNKQINLPLKSNDNNVTKNKELHEGCKIVSNLFDISLKSC